MMKFSNLFRVSFSSKFIRSSVFGLVGLMIGLTTIGVSSTARAETLVPATIEADAFWNKGGSPYIVYGTVTVPDGVTLTVGQGVEVLGDPTFTDAALLIIDGGNLVVEGKGAGPDRVSMKNFKGIEVYGGSFHIANADIFGINHFTVEDGRGILATSTIIDGHDGLKIKNSVVSVEGSKFSRLRRAITLDWTSPPVLMMEGTVAGETGGIGNALDVLDDAPVPSLTVVNSSLAGNYSYALKNYSETMVIAENNWWGRPEGPLTAGYGDTVLGPVDYEPWLASEPALDPGPAEPDCCSSILFLPGLEASSLYRTEEMPLGINTENTLWPPNRNDDVRKLFLNTDGSNPDPTIYSGEPVGKVFGVYGVYDKFTGFLDGLTSDGTVNEWKSFGYDWRAPIAEVVAGPEQKATTTEYLIQTVEDLASRSKTGKVTLIAHSNGGLVAKYLVKTLVDLGKESLIDSVVSVAVPYLGTPQAIAGLLHGDEQDIGLGFFAKRSVARQLGQNMASAYSLLPSAEYFSKVFGPTIAFASPIVPGVNDGSYPTSIALSADQDAFIVDANNVRQEPAPSKLNIPIKGNSLLMTMAETLHSIIDPFTWPATIARWTIIGWNKDTAKIVSYSAGPDAWKRVTNMGDGTVVSQSAAYEAGTAASVDLETRSNIEDANLKHANILESAATQQVIENAVEGKDEAAFCDEISQIPGVACGEPDYSREIEPVRVVISTHSPVDLHVYDANGRHTGALPRPPEVEDDVLTFYETKIKGSHFRIDETEEGDIEQYVELPDDGRSYKVVVDGIDSGSFDLHIDRTIGGMIVDHAEYIDLPTTPLAVASTTVEVPPLGDNPATTTGLIASVAEPLFLDVDGDGTVDMQAKPNQENTAPSHLDALRRLITSLLGNTNRAKQLLKRLDKIEKVIAKNKVKKVLKIADRFKNKVSNIKLGHKKFKDLTQADKEQMIAQISMIVAQFE